MKNTLKYFLLASVLVLTLSTRAHADGWGGWWPPPGTPPPTSAPEVDPSLALSGLTLLAGTLTVMRTRRRR